MTTVTFFITLVPILAFVLLTVNIVFAPHNPYQEKDTAFECGFHSFLGQNRTQFNISFFVFALLFLIFDLEILLVFPYGVSEYNNDLYGLSIMLIFFIVLTLGFVFELGKNALLLESKQTDNKNNEYIQNDNKSIEHIISQLDRKEIEKNYSIIKKNFYFHKNYYNNYTSDLTNFNPNLLFSSFNILNGKNAILYLIVPILFLVYGIILSSPYSFSYFSDIISNGYSKISIINIIQLIIPILLFIVYVLTLKEKSKLSFISKGIMAITVFYIFVWYLDLNINICMAITITNSIIITIIPLFLIYRNKKITRNGYIYLISFPWVCYLCYLFINKIWMESFVNTDFTYLQVVLMFTTISMIFIKNVFLIKKSYSRNNWMYLLNIIKMIYNYGYNIFRENSLAFLSKTIVFIILVIVFFTTLNLICHLLGLKILTTSYLHFYLSIFCRVSFIKIIASLFKYKGKSEKEWDSIAME